MALTAADIQIQIRALTQAYNPIEGEIIGEKATSLGHHGRLVEKSLAALKAFDAQAGDPETRRVLLAEAANQVWMFLVQRELCGLRDRAEVVKLYGIPQEVLVRLGAVERR